MASNVVASELSAVVGGFQVLDFSTASSIADAWSGTIPEARHFIIQPDGADLEWRADGTSPTAGNGIKITDGAMQIFENQRFLLTQAEFLGGNARVHLFG